MEPMTAMAMLVIGFTQAFMGSTVSGGGIIAIPALIATGLPPHAALGTVRPAYLFGALAANWRWRKRGYIKGKEGLTAIAPAFVGALIGASLILQVSGTIAKYLIAAVIIISILLLLIKKETGIAKKEKHSLLAITAVFIIAGIVSGAFGVAGGVVSAVGLMLVGGFTVKEAFALGSVRALGNQTAALIVFAAASSVMWAEALMLVVGSAIGATAGVEVANKVPTKALKYVFMVVAILLVASFFL